MEGSLVKDSEDIITHGGVLHQEDIRRITNGGIPRQGLRGDIKTSRIPYHYSIHPFVEHDHNNQVFPTFASIRFADAVAWSFFGIFRDFGF